MRILVAAIGAPGHAFPLVPPATALRDAGHEVVFATGPDVIDAIATTGLETVSAGGHVRDGFETDGVAGGRVRVEAFVAQAELLASDHPPVLVVHHGGSGTMLAAGGRDTAAAPAGGADQFANAAAASAIGVGAALVSARDAASIADAARALLDAGPGRAARALASEIAAMPSPADVAARVEQWARP